VDTTRIALALTLLGAALCGAADAQDAAFASSSWATSFPAPVADALGEPLADERAPLRRVRVGVVYTRSSATYAYSRVTVPGEHGAESKEEIEGTHGVHATVEVPLVPALALGARVGVRSWSVGSERDAGASSHATFDVGALLVVRIPWFWGWSLERGGMRLLGVGGLSVDTLGWDDRLQTTELSGRAGWHAGGGLGLEWLIVGRISLTTDVLYVQRQTRLHFDVPGGAAGSLSHRTHELSVALGVSVIL